MKEDVLTTATHPMTVEEYLAFEERSEIRHELVNNQLIPMPGTTIFHNAICINLTFLLRTLLKKGMFRIVQENVKIQISSNRDYTYPDIAVTCDQEDLSNQNAYFVKHPLVIFEVMSKTSRIEDSADKFIRYKIIESLRNYILVDSEKQLVEVRVKLENGDWESETYLPSNTRFPLPALGIELSIADVYEGVL
ncbi:MAG: Uma2 family endonuclease [Saprospiraceae bacterium]|nr:Uma2 family endonuclease [Saprospiraceae bacterium]